MEKEIINIGKQFLQRRRQAALNEEEQIIDLFTVLGALYRRQMNQPITQTLEYINNELKNSVNANLDNLIASKIEDPQNQKEDLMQNIQNLKNVRIRKDGRYEWRKMINGIRHYIIDRDIKILKQKVAILRKQLKKNANADIKKVKESYKLFDRIKLYHERNIKPQVKTGVLKPDSAKRYDTLMTTLRVLKKDIREYNNSH